MSSAQLTPGAGETAMATLKAAAITVFMSLAFPFIYFVSVRSPTVLRAHSSDAIPAVSDARPNRSRKKKGKKKTVAPPRAFVHRNGTKVGTFGRRSGHADHGAACDRCRVCLWIRPLWHACGWRRRGSRHTAKRDCAAPSWPARGVSPQSPDATAGLDGIPSTSAQAPGSTESEQRRIARGLQILELLVDADQELFSLSLGTPLLLGGLGGSHFRVGRRDPEVDVVDPARHERFPALEEKAAFRSDDDALGVILGRHRSRQLERIDPGRGGRLIQPDNKRIPPVPHIDGPRGTGATNLIHRKTSRARHQTPVVSRPPRDGMLPDDWPAAELCSWHDPHHVALAVENGDVRYRFFVTRKSYLGSARCPTHG